jgi:hypothetical protein
MTVTALQVVTALHPKRNGVTSDARLHVARKTKHYDDWDALVWGPLSTKRCAHWGIGRDHDRH